MIVEERKRKQNASSVGVKENIWSMMFDAVIKDNQRSCDYQRQDAPNRPKER